MLRNGSMISRAATNGMPPRMALGFTDSGTQDPENSHSGSNLERIYCVLQRIHTWVFILYSFVAGIFLIFLPRFAIWEHNLVLERIPALRPIVLNPFLKGAVLGLGIVNLLIGFWEIALLIKDPDHYLPK